MLLDLIKERHSVRSFSNQMPEDDKILNVLDAGRLAPSWVNVQPWHFIVVKDPKTKELLSKLSNGQPHVAQAPVIIVCCGDKNAWKYENFKKTILSRPGITEERVKALLDSPSLNPEKLGPEAVEYRTLEGVTYALSFMTLEAYEQGLASCIIGAIGNELTKAAPDVYSVVREELNLPEDVYPAALLLLGYPGEQHVQLPKVRKPKEQVISYERFGNENP